MPKLLIVSTVGITLKSFLVPYARFFRSLGWSVDGLARGAGEYDENRDSFHHLHEIDWSRNPLDPRNFVSAPRFVVDLVKREKYDIVHVHTPVAAFVTRFALRGLRAAGRVKVVYTAHGFHFYRGNSKMKNGLFIALEKLAGRWTDRLIVINREDYHAALRFRIVPRQNVTLMPGIGIDLTQYSRSAVDDAQVAALRREMGLTPEDRYILMVAEFNPGKRHRDAVNALAQVNFPGLHLVFAGQGALFEATKELASRRGVEKRCHFLGQRADVPALLKGAAAALLPSEREGLPRSVLEAMAMGTPVIGADARGTRDLLADNCGILVPVGDIGALAKTFKSVAEQRDELTEAARRAHEKAKDYDIKELMDMHKTLYSQLLRR
ncbi:MAG: glycosyltransferase family 4 protein [Pyramidobacter sp.]|jgi:glycosyltransferase involved in cell wall biosynthesis